MTALAATGQLLLFMVRRDRLRLALWVLGIPLFTLYFSGAITAVTDGGESLDTFAPILTNPVTALVGGPGFGYDHLTVARMIAGLYAVYLMLGAALMGITTVIRHTRVEEQSGRAGLLRAGVVGRHSSLVAALILATLMSLAVSVLCSGVLLLILPGDLAGSVLLGSSIGAVGVAFAGVAAVTTQLPLYSRTATGLAGAVLGVSFVVRGLGDMSRLSGGGWAFLSWLSPLGWAQQTGPYTLDRWWPLLLCVGSGVLLAGVGVRLQAHRDLGAGVWPDRPGKAHAPDWLSSAPALAWRLQRTSVIGWTVSLFIAGILFGSFAQSIGEGADDLPPQITDLMGGTGGATAGLVDGYLGFMGLYFGVIVAVYAVVAVQELAAQEGKGYTSVVLATGVGRSVWLSSWSVVTALASLVLLVAAGLGEGLGAAAVTGDVRLIINCVLGHLLQGAAVWFIAAVGLALYGVSLRASKAVWVVLVAGAFLSIFGEMMRLSERVVGWSPFARVGRFPGDGMDVVGVVVLVALIVVLVSVGVLGFRRRDLQNH